MLKFVNLFLGLVLVLILGLFLVLKVGPTVASGRIEAALSEKVGIKTRISSLQIKGLWPFQLAIRGVKFENSQILGRIAEILVEGSHRQSKWLLKVEVLEPQVRIRPSANSAAPAVSAAPSTSAPSATAPSGRWIDVEFLIKKGRVEWTDEDLILDNLELAVKKPNVEDLRQPAKIDVTANLQAALWGLHLQWPLAIQIQDLLTNGEYFKTQTALISLGGLNLALSGESNLRESSHRWQVQLDVPKIEDLPKPPRIIPGSNFKGQLKLNSQVEVVANVMKASGSVWLRDFFGDLRIKQDGLEVEGQVKSSLDASFIYNQSLRFPQLNLALDLSGARLQFKDLLLKDYQVPLKAEVKGTAPESIFKIENANFEVAQIKGQVQGSFNSTAPYSASVAVSIIPTSLAGLEKVILPLRSSPVEGQVDLKLQFVGPLADWKKAKIDLQSLNLIGGKGRVEWKNAEGSTQIVGPLVLKLSGSGLYENEKFVRASSAGRLDLSQLSIQSKGLYQKAANEVMTVDYDLFAPVLDQLQLRRFLVQSSWGSLALAGKVAKPLEPDLDLQMTLAKLSTRALKKVAPVVSEKIPDAMVNASLKLKGIYKFSEPNWFQQNIRVSGDLSSQVMEYKMPPTEKEGAAAPPAGAPPVVATEASSFLPAGTLTQNLDLNTTVQIQKLIKDDLLAEGVVSSGKVAGGVFKGQVQVQKVFDGGVNLQGLVVPVLDPKPVILGRIQMQNLSVEKAMGFMKPDMKDWAKGKASGEAQFKTLLPAESDFLSRLEVTGKMTANPLVLNSVQIGKMLSDLVSKVPFLKDSKIKMGSLNGRADAEFALKDKVMELKKFSAVDQEGSDLAVNGTVSLADMTMDLKGRFLWQNPSIQGCLLEGNKDDKGRMRIPLEIKGSVTSPSYGLVGNLATELGANALKCEQKKFVEKLKTEGVKKIEDEVKNKLKGLFGN